MNTAVRCKSDPVRRPSPVNLCSHHAQCEINYHLCTSLMPGLRTGKEQWLFEVGDPALRMCMQLHEAAPYTSTVDIAQLSSAHLHTPDSLRSSLPTLGAPRIRARLYHDVEMAEVIGWDNHRHWLPIYTYPNRRMYLPDEKLAINRFLGEWLSHCLKLGIACAGDCESIRITGK